MNEAGDPLLDAVEARLLGCLVEKEATTPDQYPLTENAAVQAANQKTSREPVMALDAGEVAHALRGLEAKRLARRVDGARALRFEHDAARALDLTRGQVAALPRAPGQREGRWAHLLCGPVDLAAVPADPPTRGDPAATARGASSSDDDALLARIAALEARVAALEARLAGQDGASNA